MKPDRLKPNRFFIRASEQIVMLQWYIDWQKNDENFYRFLDRVRKD